MQEKFISGSNRILKNSNGLIDTVLVGKKMTLETSVGTLVPRFTVDEESRKKEAPVKFYKSGELSSLPLEEITQVETSIGKIKAELLTFYKSGALRRLFPLNGKITGYWTEENEYTLAETLNIPTSVGTLSVKPIYLQFFETGELQSIAFWPKELIDIQCPFGKVKIRKGISFYKSGKLKGFEPAREIEVESPIGKLKVYDPDPNGLFAESNALSFYENGEVESLISSSNQVTVIKDGAHVKTFSPTMVSSYCDENAFFVSPMKSLFTKESVTFSNAAGVGEAIPASLRFEVSDFVPSRPVSGIACS